ncbi:MAG: glycosyltransferase family 2 protein [Gemmatimonadales bacterium]
MAGLYIVLSSYNGAQYLLEQIESIRGQSLSGWTLTVRDDGSSDDTPALLERLARADHRIRLLEDGRGNLGPAASFGALLEHANTQAADYIALADQDDVWHPDKLERELRLIQALEASTGASHPLLVHSDLEVVDRDLRLVHPSYFRFQRLDESPAEPLRRLLLQNFVTGCTAVMNRALLRLALPIPQVVMHDWWLAQCAAALGTLHVLPEATVRYRQHGANAVGSRGFAQLYRDAVGNPRRWWAQSRANFADAGAQVCELAARLADLPADTPTNPGAGDLVRQACQALYEPGPLRRCLEVSALGIRPRSLLAPVFFYLRILAGIRESPAGRDGGRRPAA